MILGEYLQILDNYTFARTTIDRVLVKCFSLYEFSLGYDELTTAYTAEQLDLSEAWTWISATTIIGGSGEKKQIGGRSISKSSIVITAAEKAQWLDNANRLFAKHGKPLVISDALPKIVDGSNMWGGGF